MSWFVILIVQKQGRLNVKNIGEDKFMWGGHNRSPLLGWG